MLIDSCSMVNLIAIRDILHDIHMVKKPLRVRSNAGVQTTNVMGSLSDFPEPVWHDPEAVTNILSLNTIKKYYHITYDSESDDVFVITDDQGKNLYAY